MDQSGIAADKVDPNSVGGPVQSLGEVYRGSGGAGPGDHGDGGDRDPLVDNGNAVLLADILAGFHQIFSVAADFVIDFLGGPVYVGVDAV